MSAIVLTDEAARHAIRSRLGATLFVEAGAGTGKTAELVGRVVALVGARASIRRIAAITFTEKAAAELRHRIRIELERAAAAGDVRCAEAAADVDEAPIQTLHGFAQRLLAAHPLDVGLPPGFEVMGETESSVSFADRWAAMLDRLLADPTLEPVVAPAFALGLTPAHLRAVAWELHRNWDRLLPPADAPVLGTFFRRRGEKTCPESAAAGAAAEAGAAADPVVVARRPVDVTELLDALDRVVAAAAFCTDPADRLLRHIEVEVRPYRDLLARMAATDDETEVLAVLADGRKLACSYGRAANWSGAVDVGEVRSRCAEADRLRTDLVTRVTREVFPPLLDRLRRFTLDGAERRRLDGRLEFHDLLVLARRLLRSNGAVRLAVRAELDHLLIDEFQDTDPLQIDIAVALAAADDDGGVLPPWPAVDVEPGRLFFVGDPKQSIYRFRRADIVLYRRVQERFTDEDGPLRLRQNFRSVEPVLAWVNHVFAALMGDGAGEGQPPYVPLDAAWLAAPDDTDPGPPVAVLGGPVAAPDTEAVREAEASDVATVVTRVKADGWLLSDRDDAGRRVHRPARYRDVAVLLPTRTSLPALERALDAAGVPYRVESRSLVWSTAEVRDLLAVLRAVDDPTDEVAQLAALRSPALACGDDDLLAFRLAGGRWDHRRPGPDALPPDLPVVAGMAVLHRFRQQRWWVPVSTLVEEVVRELRFLELAFAHRRQREAWHRIRFVVDQARAWVEAGGATLRGFLDWAEQQAEEHSSVVESVLPESDDDAVRVMTVHAAKGLEFPVVVLAGLHVSRRAAGGAQVLWSDDGPPQVRVGPAGARFQTPGFDDAAATEDELEAYEDVRLLYVAATRARDHLVVSLHHKEGAACAAADLCRQAEEAPHLAVRLADLVPPDAEVDQPLALAPSPPPADLIERWEAERQALVERLGRFPSLAATEAAKRAVGTVDTEEPEKEEPEADAPPWQRGRAGTAFGRAVHAVLQTVDLTAADPTVGRADPADGGADATDGHPESTDGDADADAADADAADADAADAADADGRADAAVADLAAAVAATAEAQAAAEGIPDRAAEVARAVANALRSPAAREAAASRAWREVYVAADLDGTVLEGFVDLVYETPEGLVVVDWKTDAVRTAADVDAAVARYRVQAAAYAVALERTLGRPVARCELVFTAGDGPQQRRVAQLDEAKALVAGVAAMR